MLKAATRIKSLNKHLAFTQDVPSSKMVTRAVSDPASQSQSHSTRKVEILILGAGWTSTFLIPLLEKTSVSFAATTTTGHDDTIPFRFNPETSEKKDFQPLPTADTVLITFPLKGTGQSRRLVELYEKSRGDTQMLQRSENEKKRLYIQLGSTGIFTAPHWNNSSSSYNTSNDRAVAEDELLSLSSSSSSTAASTSLFDIDTTVLNLAGLYGGARDPKAWLHRIIKTKSDIANRKALHLIHGRDVARAIKSAHENRDTVAGRRWIIMDLHVYDWWELIYEWAGLENGVKEMNLDGELVDLQQTVFECMNESAVRALPRGPEFLGRVLDGRDFWKAVRSWPVVGRVT